MADIVTMFSRMAFPDRLRFVTDVAKFGSRISPSVRFDGYVTTKENFAVRCNDGEYYVYLWRHMFGETFYIGSGKGNRWTQKNRGENFFKHLDQGDAVVYKVLDGVDEKTARMFERYASFHFTGIGYQLANKDNNIDSFSEKKLFNLMFDDAEYQNNPLTHRFEEAILNIVQDDNFSAKNVRNTHSFLERYGKEYFSSGAYKDISLLGV